MAIRIESDSIGKVKVPSEAYYGVFTQRARDNFKISPWRLPHIFNIQLAYIKGAAAKANMDLGLMDEKVAKAIIQACDEIAKGKFEDQFSIDVFQAGAGTPLNMNVNDVAANRAIEILGGKRGNYRIVHSNNDVNMAQSTNDVIPTAMRLTTLVLLQDLFREVKEFEKILRKKSKQFRNVLKTGRTHIQDAVPISLGQEFEAYADAVHKDLIEIQKTTERLKEVHMGGTAVGTGINTDPRYRFMVVKEMSRLTGFRLRQTNNMVELNWNMNTFVNTSNGLRMLAITVNKICNDFKLLVSGPKAGIAEIILHEVEPGSSIMPGKVNPSIVEAMEMATYQTMANDYLVTLGAQRSQLELNVITPVMAYNLFFSIQLLTNALRTFRILCVTKMSANVARCRSLLENSLCLATALNPYLGYEVMAFIVKEGLKKNKSLRQVVQEKNLIDKHDMERILSAQAMIKPGAINTALANKIKSSSNYKRIIAQIHSHNYKS
ncbi:aspartate ammonia-lyase [Candidatus Micrarchaeota archaeon]|nr:aspartate ammonia-lyase [Candidatus Micrarchaeota archaeon]